MWKMSTKFLLIVLYSWLVVRPTSSLFLQVKHTERKCFVQEIPDDMMVTGTFKVELSTWNTTLGDYDLLPKEAQVISETFHGLSIIVRNPSAMIILSKMYGLEGRFTFTSATSGEHVVCLEPNGTAHGYLDSYRLHLDIKVGGLAVDYDVVSKMEKLTKIQLRVRKLLDLTDQIRKEQEYQRAREARFRLTSENTRSLIFWFAVLQTVITVGVGYIQIMNLKEFFIQKKLV